MKKLALTIGVFTLCFLGNATINNSVAAPIKNSAEKRTEITVQDIINYLQQTGHVVITTPLPREGGAIWVALTNIKNDGHTYLTTVYTEGEYIVEFEDGMID